MSPTPKPARFDSCNLQFTSLRLTIVRSRRAPLYALGVFLHHISHLYSTQASSLHLSTHDLVTRQSASIIPTNTTTTSTLYDRCRRVWSTWKRLLAAIGTIALWERQELHDASRLASPYPTCSSSSHISSRISAVLILSASHHSRVHAGSQTSDTARPSRYQLSQQLVSPQAECASIITVCPSRSLQLPAPLSSCAACAASEGRKKKQKADPLLRPVAPAGNYQASQISTGRPREIRTFNLSSCDQQERDPVQQDRYSNVSRSGRCQKFSPPLLSIAVGGRRGVEKR